MRRIWLGVALGLLALSANTLSPAEAQDPDGSGGRAVAHYAGAVPATGRAIRAAAPEAELYRTGFAASEPTLGLTKDGKVFYVAFRTNTAVDILRSSDEGATWDEVTPTVADRRAHAASFDPYLYVDRATSRVFTVDLTVACAELSYTDDLGESWTTNPLACGHFVNDHQTVFAGPPVTSPTIGYPNIVYYCWNGVAYSYCSKSLNGGLTFVDTGVPSYVGVSPSGDEGSYGVPGVCGGLHGHGHVGPDGTVYLPRGFCGEPFVSISDNEGATWTPVQVASNGMNQDPAFDAAPHHETAIATDVKGNVYYAWVAADRLPYLAISRDRGATWSRPLMVGPPGLIEANLPTIAAAGKGKVAIGYLGSTNSPGPPFPEHTCTVSGVRDTCRDNEAYAEVTWNGYMTITATALAKNPLFYSATINDPADPMIRGMCGPGRCKAVYDFIDIEIGPEGTAWGAFVDGCTYGCATTGPNSFGNDGVVGRLVGGPSLR